MRRDEDATIRQRYRIVKFTRPGRWIHL